MPRWPIAKFDEVRYIRFNVSKEEFFSLIAKNILKEEGVPLEDICDRAVRIFDGIASPSTVRKLLPEHFKNYKMSNLGRRNLGRKKKKRESITIKSPV